MLKLRMPQRVAEAGCSGHATRTPVHMSAHMCAHTVWAITARFGCGMATRPVIAAVQSLSAALYVLVPWDSIWSACTAVFESWGHSRVKEYRVDVIVGIVLGQFIKIIQSWESMDTRDENHYINYSKKAIASELGHLSRKVRCL